jgi:predicted nucleic acid-binding protein
MIWFLDTNIVIFCLRGKYPVAMRRIMDTPASSIKVPFQQVRQAVLVGIRAAGEVLGRILMGSRGLEVSGISRGYEMPRPFTSGQPRNHKATN